MTPEASSQPRYNLDISNLRLADYLVRDNIMIQASGTEIEYYADARWAGRLSNLVAEKFEAEFGQHHPGRQTILISGTLSDFEQVDLDRGAEAHIRLDLEFRAPDEAYRGDLLLNKVYEARIPTPVKAPGPVVDALSAGLSQIASRIIEDANQLEIDRDQ